jgi:hypothetical protein
MNSQNHKIVVFDLDETLGYFVEFGYFIDCLNKYYDMNELSQENFNELLDLYPEFLRPKIIPILNYLKYKKKDKCCFKIMLFTNNQGPKTWAQQILNYFDKKVDFNLFDQIIAAFEINGKQIEFCRTSHEKNLKDLLKCTKLPENTEICFIDNTFYPKMAEKNVYYINMSSYEYILPPKELIKRFKESTIFKKFEKKLDEEEFLKNWKFEIKEKNEQEYEVEKIMSKQIMILLQNFFKQTKAPLEKIKKTKKLKKKGKTKTKKLV